MEAGYFQFPQHIQIQQSLNNTSLFNYSSLTANDVLPQLSIRIELSTDLILSHKQTHFDASAAEIF